MNDDIPVPTMLTIRETASKSNIASNYIRKLCLTNRICHKRVGSKYLINWEKFIEYLNSSDG